MSPISAELNIDISTLQGVTQDSREVAEGYLFAALQGDTVDGRDYIDDAIKNGATVILSDKTVKIDGAVKAVLVDNPRQTFSHVVSEYYQNQPPLIVAVTGTNGKSSVVHFINQLWRAAGKKSGFIGTLSGNLTTPDPVIIHANLRQMQAEGITHVAMEASSHGLEQYRMDGVKISVAAFTNFSQDHLDYHKEMESYFSSKTRLFSELLTQNGVAVLNADSAEEYKRLKNLCVERGIRVISYGAEGEDIKLISVATQGITQEIKAEILGRMYRFVLPLVGHFQVANVLCALGCIFAEDDSDIDFWMGFLSGLDSVPGRLQLVTGGGLRAYVDYAHTPDALENVLDALRPDTKGRLLCVFGCGGDRDSSKRSQMGKVVSRIADVAIVTDDNPRSENPEDIRRQVLSGMNDTALEIADRRAAILAAVEMMDEDDVLLVAGKGHEQGQIFNGGIEPFDDVEEVHKALNTRV